MRPRSEPGGLTPIKRLDPILSPSNSLPNDKILDWSKLKAFSDHEINVTKKLKFVLGKVENIVEKEKNVFHQHFLLFPQCFQKATFTGSSGLCGKELITLLFCNWFQSEKSKLWGSGKRITGRRKNVFSL